jgi:glycerophosphoryl diester phosphodiesterase
MNAMLRAAAEGRVLVYGHRGARAYAPMNTIPSFALAIDQGADGIELDVQLTADGELVVIHDFTVDGTTDGSGAVKDLLHAEIKELDAAARFAPQATPLSGRAAGPFGAVRVPTLEEVFVLVCDAAPADFIVNVEIKAPYCGADGKDTTDGVEAAVADRILRYGMSERVVVSSFNPPTLRRFKKIAPTIPVGFLYEENGPIDTAPLMAGAGHEAWHPRFSLATDKAIAAERAAGRIVNVWTVNDEAEARRLAADGAAGIITDTVDRILAALSR